MAIVSILHRLSGLALFLLLPFLLYFLDISLESGERFSQVSQFFQGFPGKLLLWVTISTTLFHVVAGIRHLLMDFGIGETLKGGRCSAWTVMITSAVLALLTGIWLW